MKQRLVGTLVLGCLALIFIPLMLDGEGIDSGPVIAPLPPMPQLPVLDIPEPQRPVILADLDTEAAPEPETEPVTASETTDTTSVSSSEPATDTSIEDTPRRDSAGLPEGWSVRLGVFADRSNADALLKRLIDADHKAYSRPVRSGSNTLTGIFVGPVLTRADANSLLSELSRSFQQNGIVVRYELDTPPRQ